MNRSLSALHLGGNMLKKRSGVAFFNALIPNPTLTKLTLGSNPINLGILNEIAKLLERNKEDQRRKQPQTYRLELKVLK